MNYNIEQVAERIRGLRDLLEISVEEMAQITNTSVKEYRAAEAGETDFSFTFLYLCAERFGVDIMELATGEVPRLSFYSIVRSGKGVSVSRRSGLVYNHLAYTFKEKIAEPFLVRAPYNAAEEEGEIHLSYHEGQEMDYILEGTLKCSFEGRIEYLGAGDCVYYNSGRGHGMVASGGEDCVFLAIVMKNQESEDE